jgi:malonate decarboxylase alpha subunit
LLEAIIEPGDRVAIEGDNQKQADFLASALGNVNPGRVHDLHMVQSVLALPDHLAVFERGIANRLDFSYAGPQSRRLAELVASKALTIGAIHTYLELYARWLVDLNPHVALIVADKADRDGNLYTGPNTEDTPTITEAAAFRGGIVVAQVNKIVDRLPRVDVPGDWVDVVIPSPKPYRIDPLFTRDPAKIRDENVLMAMMAIAAVYEPYEVRRLNHGIGYATAAIELIVPTFATQRGLKGKIARHFVLNPHPTLIPAIEAGFVDSVYCFGSELGMERYVSRHADIFPVGPDGNLRSNRALAQVAGQYACDLFIGGTLQIDAQGNSSTATKGRITGFGGAPNMGADPRGRRHDSPTWLHAGQEAGDSLRGRKLVVQMVQTRQPNGAPSFVERLDAFDLAASAGFALPPVMIYGDDVTHVITEQGVAHLLRCRSPLEREAALRAVAGDTDFGKRQSLETTDSLRRRGIVMFPSDLGIDAATATRDWLAAKSIDDLVTASGGLYEPPAKFRPNPITHV